MQLVEMRGEGKKKVVAARSLFLSSGTHSIGGLQMIV